MRAGRGDGLARLPAAVGFLGQAPRGPQEFWYVAFQFGANGEKRMFVDEEVDVGL